MAWNDNQGFYLVHSLPKYPFIDQNGNINISIDDSENIYGQHLMCLSLSKK